MRSLKAGLAVVITCALGVAAFAAGGDAVLNKITQNGYTFMIHLRAVPEQYKKDAKGSHHLAVMIRGPEKMEVTDATVSFEFIQNGKAVVSGQLPWMARGERMRGGGNHPMSGDNMGMGGEHRKMMTGHYGSVVTLPETGAYNLNITMKRGDKTVKATTLITAP